MVNPRYFAAEALSSSTLCKYTWFEGFNYSGNMEDLAFRRIKLHIPLFPLFETC